MRDFLDYHRALGKRFPDSEAWALSLFDRYLVEQKVEECSRAITPLMVENFPSVRGLARWPRVITSCWGVLQRWF